MQGHVGRAINANALNVQHIKRSKSTSSLLFSIPCFVIVLRSTILSVHPSMWLSMCLSPSVPSLTWIMCVWLITEKMSSLMEPPHFALNLCVPVCRSVLGGVCSWVCHFMSMTRLSSNCFFNQPWRIFNSFIWLLVVCWYLSAWRVVFLVTDGWMEGVFFFSFFFNC